MLGTEHSRRGNNELHRQGPAERGVSNVALINAMATIYAQEMPSRVVTRLGDAETSRFPWKQSQ